MHSDPVADMITRLRNGYKAGLASVNVPYSRLKADILALLRKEGYINEIEEHHSDVPSKRSLKVALRYYQQKEPVMQGVKRLSSPGLRSYFSCSDIPKVRGGLGIVVLSTSKGLMTDAEARRTGIGGEAICAVW